MRDRRERACPVSTDGYVGNESTEFSHQVLKICQLANVYKSDRYWSFGS